MLACQDLLNFRGNINGTLEPEWTVTICITIQLVSSLTGLDSVAWQYLFLLDWFQSGQTREQWYSGSSRNKVIESYLIGTD